MTDILHESVPNPDEYADDCLRTGAEVRDRGEADRCSWCGYPAAAHPTDTPEPSTPPAQPSHTAPAAAGRPPGTLDGPGVLGRALLDRDGNAWPASDRAWAESEYGPIREVLLVDPAHLQAAGRVLDAAWRVAEMRTLGDAADWRQLAAAHRELRAAVDAYDRPTAGADVNSTANNIRPEANTSGSLPSSDRVPEVERRRQNRIKFAGQLPTLDANGEWREPGEPDPEPAGDGLGWERATIGEIGKVAHGVGVNLAPEKAAQVIALLADRDRQAQVAWNLLAVAQQRFTALERVNAELDTARAELAEMERVREIDRESTLTLLRRRAADHTELERLRAELATARRDAAAERRDIVNAAERREALIAQHRQHMESCIWLDPGRRSGAPCLGGTRLDVDLIAGLIGDGMDGDAIRGLYPDVTDGHLIAVRHFVREVDRERADAAADALDWLARHWVCATPSGSETPYTRDERLDIAQRAAEIRADERPVPGSPAPATDGGEESDDA